MTEDLSMQGTSLSLIPSRLGFDRAVDLACDALTKAISQGGALTRPGVGELEYTKAVSCTRKSLESVAWNGSEHAILAVLLLMVHDLMKIYSPHSYMPEHVRRAEMHGKGVAILLKARTTVSDTHARGTQLLKTMVYDAWMSTFVGLFEAC